MKPHNPAWCRPASGGGYAARNLWEIDYYEIVASCQNDGRQTPMLGAYFVGGVL
jgi:hypothetical protein